MNEKKISPYEMKPEDFNKIEIKRINHGSRLYIDGVEIKKVSECTTSLIGSATCEITLKFAIIRENLTIE